jgi:alkaline phosphatase D
MEVLKEKYDLQKKHAGYEKLRREMPVIGVWDDHDYG